MHKQAMEEIKFSKGHILQTQKWSVEHNKIKTFSFFFNFFLQVRHFSLVDSVELENVSCLFYTLFRKDLRANDLRILRLFYIYIGP